MAISVINPLRSRKKPTKETQEAGEGDQIHPPTEVTEVAVVEKESQCGDEIEIEIEVIITQYRQKKWFLIRLSSVFYLISVVFLILVEIGNTRDEPGLRDSWFLKIDASNVLPISPATDATLVNSIARSLGIHDFYTVGLWNYCAGYNDEGITYCSKPKNLWWFNPVEIMLSELLAGATIALPSQVTLILTLIHVVSNFMFGAFMFGLCNNFTLIFLSPLALLNRWYSYHFVIFAFISALFSFIGSALATSMYVTFQKVITSQKELNIAAELGPRMFAFMWIGTSFSLAAWIVHLHLAIVSRREHHDTMKDRRERREKREEGKPRRKFQVPKWFRSKNRNAV